MDATEPWVKAFLLDVLRLPARILTVGFAILILVLVWEHTIGTSLSLSFANRPDASWAGSVIPLVVFAAGVTLIIMLWWMTARFFRLVESKTIDATTIAAFKDLPMGLPEGTIRAILALVVAMIGLPVLLFQDVLDLSPEIAGYVNGIVAGVFGFYFGTRTSGVPTSAVEKMADAQQTAIKKADEAADARVQAANAQGAAAAALADTASVKDAAAEQLRQVKEAGNFEGNLSKVERHLALARIILDEFSDALPPGTIPAGTAEMLTNAEKVVSQLRGVTTANAAEEQVDQLASIAEALTGDKSPVSVLLKNAATLLPTVLPIPGLGPLASLVTLLGIGAKLGSSQYQRWRARVLKAPVSERLVEFGTMTTQVIRAALAQAPNLRNALAHVDRNIAESVLANVIASSDPAGNLLKAFGPEGAAAPNAVPDAATAQAGIAELQQALLSLYSANDVQPATVQQVADAFTSPALPELADVQSKLRALAPSSVNQLIDAVSGISADTTFPESQRAAFDALVNLVDTARHQNIDLVAALAELRQ